MMRIPIRNESWELCDGKQCEGREIRPLAKYSEALQLLERLTADAVLMQSVRRLGLRLGSVSVGKMSDRDILELVARSLSRKQLHLCRLLKDSGGDGEAQPAPPKAPAAPVQVAQKAKKTWVEFVVIDMEGNPAAGQHYIVMLPDGSLQEGKLPKNGKVRFDGIDPENSVFTLPDLDQDKWARIS
jgi:hypothetical protein